MVYEMFCQWKFGVDFFYAIKNASQVQIWIEVVEAFRSSLFISVREIIFC